MYEKSSDEERLDHRKNSVKPLMDAYFEWIKENAGKTGLDKSSKLAGALDYSIHQEQFLRVFLEDPKIPLDNNDAERSIRSFCVGKHSWHIIDSKNGAEASAALYSIAETAKANDLKPYEYFSYLLEQLMHYPRNNVPDDELVKLMPWSEELPDRCRKLKTR
ncbi:IS66 family transposase [Lacrimispora saccharolytica]|nr:transposase [Lacrimispora saccharolytica]